MQDNNINLSLASYLIFFLNYIIHIPLGICIRTLLWLNFNLAPVISTWKFRYADFRFKNFLIAEICELISRVG